ncbi:MAG: Vancomycin B-type resistance protein VanW [Candidatus Ozemobacter sibiricus]|jgi:vancomycin resistance protein YoaR|uniref:Vancomycin B-type resistance protein VanW n=1 Tax=Candidatus Ozemobacter sibiricus TaxID=2268124 RepID=A0A367ZUJ3_9BACT|nr:MAG: Vancomycin B-type resistance protein VanW [Candidatus Ozemobacter sibiricus]
MRKVFYVILGITCLSAFLIFLFWGITSIQRATQTIPSSSKAPTVSSAPHPEEPMAAMSKPQPVPEVEVVFQLDDRTINLGKVPLLKPAGGDQAAAAPAVDVELARRLVEQIPEPAPVAPPVPAKLETDQKGTPRKINRGNPGQVIDREGTVQRLAEVVTRVKPSQPVKITVPRREPAGIETLTSLRTRLGFKECLAEFETVHDKDHIDDVGRNINLRIAAEKVDGIILQPGEEFSFNRIVGPRGRKEGFQPAGVISNGKVVPGLGGGICQVSTTLYRCALLSAMKIVERHNHSIYDGIAYAQRGLDAAVVWGAKDFRFVNTLNTPVLILCQAGRGSVKAAFYAQHRPFDKVELITRNEVKHPFPVQVRKNPRLKNGETRVIQPGVTGYTVEAYRIVTIKGVTREEPLSKDRYQTFPRIEEVSN